MTRASIPELHVWAEFYCPWCHITAVTLDRIQTEYAGRVALRFRFFPLELLRPEPAPRPKGPDMFSMTPRTGTSSVPNILTALRASAVIAAVRLVRGG